MSVFPPRFCVRSHCSSFLLCARKLVVNLRKDMMRVRFVYKLLACASTCALFAEAAAAQSEMEGAGAGSAGAGDIATGGSDVLPRCVAKEKHLPLVL